MTTLQDLTHIRAERIVINSIRSRMQLLLDSATSVSVQLTGMPKGGGQNDKLERYVDDSRDMAFDLLVRVTQYEEDIERIEADVEMLPMNEQTMIRLYYFDGLYWDKVAKITNYDERTCRLIRDKAIKKLSEMRG